MPARQAQNQELAAALDSSHLTNSQLSTKLDQLVRVSVWLCASVCHTPRPPPLANPTVARLLLLCQVTPPQFRVQQMSSLKASCVFGGITPPPPPNPYTLFTAVLCPFECIFRIPHAAFLSTAHNITTA